MKNYFSLPITEILGRLHGIDSHFAAPRLQPDTGDCRLSFAGCVGFFLNYLIQTKIWESFFWGGGGQIYAWGIACALAAWIFLGDALEKPTRTNLTAALLLAFLSSGFAQLINLAMLIDRDRKSVV